MSLLSFPSQNFEFQFYPGPPEQKPTKRRKDTKTPLNRQKSLTLDEGLGIGFTPSTHQAGHIDLAPASKDTCGLELFGCKGDLDCSGSSHTQDDEGMEVEHPVPSEVLYEALGVGGSRQPALSKGDRSDCAIVIADDLSELCDIDGNYGHSHSLDLSTQHRDGLGDKIEGLEDAISPGLVDVPNSQAARLALCELLPISLTSSAASSATNIQQTTQKGRNGTLSAARTDQLPRPVHRIAEVQDEYAPLVMTSSCNGRNRLDGRNNTSHENDDHDDDNDDKADSTNSTDQVRERKRALSPEPTKSTSTSSKRFLTDTGRLRPEKRPKSGHSSRRRNRKHDRGSANKDEEYEVEEILEVRVHHGKLQYRAKWLGYKIDRTWYYASGFKNSPRKLRDFHGAHPAKPGPPVRLEEWETCWEEERDADDHPDDNKPRTTHTRRGTQ